MDWGVCTDQRTTSDIYPGKCAHVGSPFGEIEAPLDLRNFYRQDILEFAF
jgi:hypothetical protein